MEAGFPERPVIGLLLHAAAARVEEHWAQLTSPAEFEALRASLVRLLAEPSDRWRVRVRRAQPSSASTAAAALSPDRTAPSIYPHQSGEVSVPAQWIGPTGVLSACPYLVHTSGPKSVP